MKPANDTLDRIFAAADGLYEQLGQAGFPTVDAVRKAAKVNMNDASNGMKEWRRAHTVQASAISVPVPEPVQQAGAAALAVLWREAQELANQSLRSAQAAWEVDRAEAETLTKQMADAFEAQSAELEALQAELAQMKFANAALEADKARLDGEIASALTAAAHAQVRTDEIERRATELRTELDYTHHEISGARAELASAHQTHASEAKALRAEIAAARTKSENERDKARNDAMHAHSEIAVLQGQVESLKEQNALLTLIASPPQSDDSTRGSELKSSQ